AAGAEGDRLEVAEPPGGKIIIDPELIDQLLGVERPAFRISIEGQYGADQRHLVGIFALPDMARDRLVRREVGQAVFAVQAGIAKVDPELARDLAVDRAGAAV